MTSAADRIIDDTCQRLVAMADDPPYRFLDTSRRDAESYQQRKKTFVGYSAAEVSAAEQRLGVEFPTVFRAYMESFGKAQGDLFRGSDLAGLDDLEDFKADAEELMREFGAEGRLLRNAVVFLFHQGYSFAFISADGDFDSPVFWYVEGDKTWSQSAAGFAEFMDAQICIAEKNHREFHERGGYYVTIGEGDVTESYPALAKGDRPLDGVDSFKD